MNNDNNNQKVVKQEEGFFCSKCFNHASRGLMINDERVCFRELCLEEAELNREDLSSECRTYLEENLRPTWLYYLSGEYRTSFYRNDNSTLLISRRIWPNEALEKIANNDLYIKDTNIKQILSYCKLTPKELNTLQVANDLFYKPVALMIVGQCAQKLQRLPRYGDEIETCIRIMGDCEHHHKRIIKALSRFMDKNDCIEFLITLMKLGLKIQDNMMINWTHC